MLVYRSEDSGFELWRHPVGDWVLVSDVVSELKIILSTLCCLCVLEETPCCGPFYQLSASGEVADSTMETEQMDQEALKSFGLYSAFVVMKVMCFDESLSLPGDITIII